MNKDKYDSLPDDLKKVIDSELAGMCGQRFAVYQAGTHMVKRPFVQIGIVLKKGFGDDEIQHRIAQNFQSLVVSRV